MGDLLRTQVAAHRVEVEKLFRRVVFNYVFANGDAHLKNFSLYRTAQGDYVLTPAYDLLCTRLHLPNESRLALNLFEDEFETPSFQVHGFHTGACFRELGRRFGLVPSRMEGILAALAEEQAGVVELVGRSYLSDDAKAVFMDSHRDRLLALSFS